MILILMTARIITKSTQIYDTFLIFEIGSQNSMLCCLHVLQPSPKHHFAPINWNRFYNNISDCFPFTNIPQEFTHYLILTHNVVINIDVENVILCVGCSILLLVWKMHSLLFQGFWSTRFAVRKGFVFLFALLIIPYRPEQPNSS